MTAIRDDEPWARLPTAAAFEATEGATLRPRSGRPSGAYSTPTFEHALVTHHVHRSFAVASLGPLLIAMVNGAVRGDRIRTIVETARSHCERYPEGGGFSLVVGTETGLPDADARRLMSQALDELGGYIQAAAVIIDRDGFSAATARSVVSTMFFATGRRLTMRVFKSVTAAATWQARAIRHEPPLDADRIAEAVERVRRQQQTQRSSAHP